MNRTAMAVLLSAGLIFSVAGDDLEDFIQVCAKMSSNYNRVIRSKGTRFDQEYQINLDHLKSLSNRIQPVIRRLGIGQDIDFPQMTAELEQIYLSNQNPAKGKGGAKLHPHSSSPEGLLKVLTADVRALRKMDFTTEEGGSIKTSLETKRRLLEYRRLLDFFRQNYTKINRGPQNKDPSLERFFQQRTRRMSALSVDLMEIARRKYPGTLSKNNLQTETNELLKHYEAWSELKWKKTGSKPRSRNKNHKNTKRMDGLNTTAALHTEIITSLRNLSDLLVQWEQAGFKSDDPIDKKTGDTADRSDPAAVMRQDNNAKDYSSMSTAELTRLLEKRRREIIRGNRSMEGFDRDAERKYLLTLPREYKRSYNEFLRNFQQQGYSSGQAVRSAILKVHTKIQMEGKTPPAKEMIRMLTALDKDKDRTENQKGVEFKLERTKGE